MCRSVSNDPREVAQVMKLQVISPSRRRLEARVGQKIRVTAVYVRIGIRQAGGRSYPTVLVRNVRDADSGRLLADHLWFNRGSIWKKTRLRLGDTVEFEARAIEYRTGYWGPDPIRRLEEPPRVDFKLTPPAGLRVAPWIIDQGEAA